MFDYSQELVKTLKHDRFLRHLFNKLGKTVEVRLQDEKIVGILKTIEFVRGRINIEVQTKDHVYFINWRHVVYLKVMENVPSA